MADSTIHHPPPVSPPLDVARLRHHTEPSRFALAVLASGLGLSVVLFALLAAAGPLGLVALLALLVPVGTLWFAVQLARVRLLGKSIRVGPETFPELQSAIDEVRARLAYDGRVDVFVLAKLEQQFLLTSYFGARVLLIDGPTIADLTQPQSRPQLIYLLASQLGGLKAKHARWEPALVALNAMSLLRVLNPLITPWYRATVYTGDQIAYACTRDLAVSLQAVHRILVGREIEPQLRAAGVVTQANLVRHSLIMRLAQLFQWAPHATNRYLNMLAFARSMDPGRMEVFRAQVGDAARPALDDSMARLAPRPSSTALVTAAGVVSACVLGASVVGGLVVSSPPGSSDDSGSSPLVPTPTPTPAPVPTPTVETPVASPTPTPEPATDLSSALLEYVPEGLRDDCQIAEASDSAAGAVAAVDCYPLDSGTPDYVSYVLFADDESMDADFDIWAFDVEEGSCQQPNHVSTWTDQGVDMGRLVCNQDSDSVYFVWTHTGLGVEVYASSDRMTHDEMLSWWGDWAKLAV
jgi:hypothetical protein